MTDDPLKPGGALEGSLFRGFLKRLAEAREPEHGDRIGAWKILQELGRGGSGVVFLAARADGAFSQQVALKWLRGDRPVPGGREALARERELLSSFDHPHIARLVDGGETEDGMLWFAMDYVAGDTIDRHAHSLALSKRIRLMDTLCRAVHHAHRRGLIHGDIKPSNVLVDDRGQPRLVDFGISRLRGTAIGSSYGLTPDYASPEQRSGDPLTTASDIWQLGRLLEDLAGSDPVPADLRAVMELATAESPEDRYSSVSAMAADLRAWLDHYPVAAHRGGPGYRLGRFIRRNRALSAVTLVALAIIIGGGIWMTLQLADERDAARAEAARAEAALAETEAALARAEALHEFLVDLFQATRPARPVDQLPSTEDILARGAERALQADAISPSERYGMLSAIGQVYLAHSRYEDTEPLFDAALDLARSGQDLRSADRAQALAQKADLMIRAGESLDEAEALLREAESLVAGRPEAWETFARIRITRTWVDRHRGEHAQALERVAPLYAQMQQLNPDDQGIRAGVFDSLAGLHLAAGNLEVAARFRAMATEAFRQHQGPEGQGYVVSLANGAGLQRSLGRFEQAESRARKAIALYDRIYEGPTDYRASARLALARTLLAMGRTEEAFEQLQQSGSEFASVMDKAPDEWPLYFSLRGTFHARLHQLEAAERDLVRAAELMATQDEYDDRLNAVVQALNAWVLCRQGRVRAGRVVLDQMEHAETLLGRPRNRAQLEEARAACYFRSGQLNQGLAAIEAALAAHDPPGSVMASTDRRILHARLLAAVERPDEAARVLDQAEGKMVDLGLVDHPLRAVIDSVREELL